jgi:hypothetical protein
MAEKGAVQAQEAVALYHRIINTATFVHVSVVENIRYPQSELWRTVSSKNNGKPELSHFQKNWVTVRIEKEEVVIAWDKVESYQCIE